MMPKGVSCIDITANFFYQNYLALPTVFGGDNPYPPDTNEAKEVTGEVYFMLKSLSGLPYQNPTYPDLLYLQIMFPSGRVMQNVLTDISPDLGFGSGRCIFDNPIPCPPGSKFFITLDSSISGDFHTGGEGTIPVVTGVMFEGALRYFLRPNASTPPQHRNGKDSAADLPRFFYDTPNQNIMAPEWMVAGHDGVQCTPECPPTFRDRSFTYSNTNSGPNGPGTKFSEVAPAATYIVIPMESSSDFLCRRLLFSVQPGNISPVFWIRLRTSLAGSSITNDYMPLQSIRLHKDWLIKRSTQAYIDVFGVSNGGTGTTTVYAYLEGVKRGWA
jgi:hypothetical protein